MTEPAPAPIAAEAMSCQPDAARARTLDRAMHRGLADSLAHIAEQSRGEIAFDEPEFRHTIAAIRERRFSPLTFALYYDLVFAIEAGRHDEAAALIARIASATPVEGPTVVCRIEDPPVGANATIYRDKMETDAELKFGFLQPSEAEARAFMDLLGTAQARFGAVLPQLFAEMEALITELILATEPEDGSTRFTGGSSYMLWGALFLNPRAQTEPVTLVEAIAHECGHAALFGHTIEEPLVRNPDGELFTSPLRDDPRPMDGIYHATWVSARMAWAMATLVASGALEASEIDLAGRRLEADRASFHSGLETVRRHGSLSAAGASLMAGAEADMAALAAA
jgi:hypothetical protein